MDIFFADFTTTNVLHYSKLLRYVNLWKSFAKFKGGHFFLNLILSLFSFIDGFWEDHNCNNVNKYVCQYGMFYNHFMVLNMRQRVVHRIK